MASFNPLLYPIDMHIAWGSGDLWVNLIAALLSSALLAVMVLRSRHILLRPMAMVVAMMMVFYQWPLVVISPLLYERLPNVAWFIGSIHALVALGLAWLLWTPRLNVMPAATPTFTEIAARVSGRVIWFPVALLLVLAAIYTNAIPFQCSALYALVVDPELSHIVREITGKLTGAWHAPHILNMITGAVGPIVAFLATLRALHDMRHKRALSALGWMALMLVALIMPLLSGAKGTLISTAVILAVAGFLLAKNWKRRFVVAASTMAVLMLVVLSIKTTTEGQSGKGSYDFGACAATLGVCEKVRPLLSSLRAPDFSLGLDKNRISELEAALDRSCPKSTAAPPVSKASSTPTHYDTPKKQQYTPLQLLNFVMYRIFITPVQVASWHYLYTYEHGAPGMAGLSIAKYVMADRYINIPSKICQSYYSGGDKTATCTAPTGFLFTYPAYLGAWGLALAFIAIVSFDIMGALLLRHLRQPYSSLTAGLLVAASINFMISDFVTVMLSHGALLGMAIMAWIAWQQGRQP